MLIIYLPKVEFEKFSKNLSEKSRIIFLNDCILLSFKLNENNFVFILTREDFQNKDKRQYDRLKNKLEKHLTGKYYVVLAFHHAVNISGLLPKELTLRNYGGMPKTEFYNKIKTFFSEYTKENYDTCVDIIDRFKNEYFIPQSPEKNLEIDFNLNKVKDETPEEPISFHKADSVKKHDKITELDKIIENIKKEDIHLTEIVLVIYPLANKDDKTIANEYIDTNKLFFSIREEIGDDSKHYRTNLLKKILDISNDNVKIYMALHRLQDSVDIKEISDMSKIKKITLYYCNFSRINQYKELVNAYENIVNKTDIKKNYDKLKQVIKKISNKSKIVEAADKIIQLFFPLAIDLSGIIKVKNEEKVEYLYSIRNSTINQESNIADPSYFRRKLVNLRFFVSGKLKESEIDHIAPTMDEFVNLASLPINKKLYPQLKNLCGYGDKNSVLEKFVRNLDQLLVNLKNTNINSISSILLEHFERNAWSIDGKKIRNFNEWYLLLITTINNIIKEMQDDQH